MIQGEREKEEKVPTGGSNNCRGEGGGEDRSCASGGGPGVRIGVSSVQSGEAREESCTAPRGLRLQPRQTAWSARPGSCGRAPPSCSPISQVMICFFGGCLRAGDFDGDRGFGVGVIFGSTKE